MPTNDPAALIAEAREMCEFCDGRQYWVSEEGAEIQCDFCSFATWVPSAANINRLPGPIRRYIHDIETRCDPAGDIQTIAVLRENLEAALRERDDSDNDRTILLNTLSARNARIAELERERDEAFDAAKEAQPHVCSFLCPSTRRDGEEWKHSRMCQKLSALKRTKGTP